jgi:hypothetical protein
MAMRAIFLGLVAFIPLAACGSRGPLDVEIVEATEADAAVVDAVVAPAVDASDAAQAHDAPIDAGHEATLVDCGQCLSQKCGAVFIECIQSAPCRATFQCVAQKCVSGGTPDPSCITKCANDPKSIGTVLAVITCVTSKCGPDCTSVLGGLGGLGGGGGGR